MPATTDLTAALILGDATSPDMGGPQALGHDLGATLSEAEVRWLMTHEYARHAADVVWRRSKLGLRMTADEVEELEGGCGGLGSEPERSSQNLPKARLERFRFSWQQEDRKSRSSAGERQRIPMPVKPEPL